MCPGQNVAKALPKFCASCLEGSSAAHQIVLLRLKYACCYPTGPTVCTKVALPCSWSLTLPFSCSFNRHIAQLQCWPECPHPAKALIKLLQSLPVLQVVFPCSQGLGIAHAETLPIFQMPFLLHHGHNLRSCFTIELTKLSNLGNSTELNEI